MLKALLMGLAVFLLTATSAHSNGISISPILLTVPETGGPASLKVGSSRESKTTIQVRIFEWHQEDGAEVLTEAADIRYAPEFFELEPGKEKTIRMRVPDTQGKGIWKIVLDELPSADEVDSPLSDNISAMQLRVRYVVSMFASNVSDGQDLTFDLTGTGESKKLAITNNGTSYARIFDVTLEGASKNVNSTTIRPELIYILPGSTVTADILAAPASPDTVSFKIGEDQLTAPLK